MIFVTGPLFAGKQEYIMEALGWDESDFEDFAVRDVQDLAADLKFIETFRPEMCGIGPFIPHRDTPFGGEPGGSVELTC